MGSTDTDYLEICDLVVNVALGICVTYLSKIAEASKFLFGDQRRHSLISALANIKPAFETIGHLDMSPLNRRKYNELSGSLGLQKSFKSTPSSGGGCYIATMVYGSYDASEVIVLRKFRDKVLQQSWIGREFIKIYYKYSPSLVRKTKHLKIVHVIFKLFLDPFVNYLKRKDD